MTRAALERRAMPGREACRSTVSVGLREAVVQCEASSSSCNACRLKAHNTGQGNSALCGWRPIRVILSIRSVTQTGDILVKGASNRVLWALVLVPPTPPASQNDLGVLGKDLAGFSNGSRPCDDVADIELRALEGALCGTAGSCGSQTSDPNNGAPYTDGARAAGPDAANVHLNGKINAGDTYLDVFCRSQQSSLHFCSARPLANCG
jgi:hypothetical protein